MAEKEKNNNVYRGLSRRYMLVIIIIIAFKIFNSCFVVSGIEHITPRTIIIFNPSLKIRFSKRLT